MLTDSILGPSTYFVGKPDSVVCVNVSFIIAWANAWPANLQEYSWITQIKDKLKHSK